MIINAKTKAFLQLHVAVMLFGFTAILGKLIVLSALVLVWWRVLITAASLFIFLRLRGRKIILDSKRIKIYMAIGGVIAIHWLTFYGAVKLSNSSITLLCMATTSFFTSFIEPVFFKRPLEKIDIAIGCIIVPVMALIAKDIQTSYLVGALVGLLSAFLAAYFSVLNKKYIEDVPPMVMSFWEIVGVLGVTSVMVQIYLFKEPTAMFLPPDMANWVYIFVLAIACTTVAWVLSLYALRHLSAFENNLVVNLEPVYGILLAAAILQEHKELNTGFYVGGSIILVLVLAYPTVKRKLVAQSI